jgi:hypothetical protein
MDRRSFIGSVLGLAGAAALGDLPAIALPAAPPPPLPTMMVMVGTGDSLQAAIDSLPPEGGKIYLCPWTRICAEAIKIPENVSITATGNVSFVDCSITAAAPILLHGQKNLISGCYLQAKGKLNRFFEVQSDCNNIVIGTFWERAREAIEKPFREVLELIGRP